MMKVRHYEIICAIVMLLFLALVIYWSWSVTVLNQAKQEIIEDPVGWAPVCELCGALLTNDCACTGMEQ